MPAPTPSELDGNQVLQHAFEDATGTLRTTAVATVVSGDITIESNHEDDSIAVWGTDGIVDRQLKTDSSGELQIDVLSSVLPSGAATSALQTTGNASLASIDSKLTSPITVIGALTDAQLRATPVPVSGTFFQTTQPISAASLPLPTDAATSALQISGNTSLASIDLKLTSPITISQATASNLNSQVVGNIAAGVADAGNPVKAGGKYNSTPPTLTTGQRGDLQLDSAGNLRVVYPGNTILSQKGLVQGDVTLTLASVEAVVRRTVYTEQTTNAQRSIASSSANDTSAGTGARTVKITYYTATFTGPFTETITLNGVSFVNSVSTTICYIEKMEVMTVGSTGSNVGILTLRAAAAGGGAVIGTVSALGNSTFWAHHYVATGKTAYLTQVSTNNTSTTPANGAIYYVKAKNLTVSDSTDAVITPVVRLFGQSSTFAYKFQSEIPIIGPARITLFTVPETGSTQTFRGSFEFFEE